MVFVSRPAAEPSRSARWGAAPKLVSPRPSTGLLPDRRIAATRERPGHRRQDCQRRQGRGRPDHAAKPRTARPRRIMPPNRGLRVLGASVGSHQFVHDYLENKAEETERRERSLTPVG